ncbi:MAG: TolC family protein [Candidatus Aminicenantales bacterium]
MIKRILGAAGLLIFIFTVGAFAQNKKSLSLEDCFVSAMQNNLKIAAEVLNPELADLSVLRANEKFMPTLSFTYSNEETNSASYSWIDAAGQVNSASRDYEVSLSQYIPTGGTLTTFLSSYRTETNRSFQTINPRYGSTLSFNFTQPLLRNFGFKTSRKEIIIAKNNREVTEKQFQDALMDILFNVEEAYWNLVYSIENLKVREQSLQLARDLLKENQRKVEVGTMAPIDLYTAQAEVATREADILQAEALVKNSEDRLKSIINISEAENGEDVELFPTDKPRFEERDIELDTALAIALEKRPDLKAAQIDMKNKELNVSFAANQLLPELNFSVSYWSPGISGDQILYQDNDAFSRIVVGKVPGASTDALKDALNFKYNNWSVGLTLRFPLSTVLSRAEYAQTKVSLKQADFNLRDQERQMFLEIKTAVRAVQLGYKRVQAYTAARQLAEKKLEAEGEKFNVGKSTNYLLLQYQRDLADARSAELKATVDYTLSQAYLDKVLGTMLESKNIQISDIGLK